MFGSGNTLLNDNPGRIALLVEAGVPPVIFLLLGFFMWRATTKPIPRPSGSLFMVLWFCFVVAFTIALVITALDEISVVTVCLIGSFSIVALICCMVFMTTYGTDKASAANLLMIAAMMMSMATVASLSGDPLSDKNSVTTSSVLYAFVSSMLGTGVVMTHVYLQAAQ